MALLRTMPMYMIVVTVLAIQVHLSASIGVNYGRMANNLPPPKKVIEQCQKCGIQLIRLFEPSSEVLEALRGSSLQVSLGVRNEDVQSFASSPEAASKWVNTNVAPYKNDVNFKWIVLGNEIIPGGEAPFAAQAMQNIHNAINSIGLTNTKVTTSFHVPGLATSSPPSAGVFTSEVASVMPNIIAFLTQTGSPLMVNPYPYYAYSSNPAQISLEFALFQAKNPVIDGDLKYFSLFDAMVDAVYAALDKIGGTNVPIVIAETGWPTAGNEPYSSKKNAQIYNQNVLKYLQAGRGTPKRPEQPFEIFIFSMFNENMKQAGVEQNWGLFYPDMTPVYPLLQC